MNESTRAYIYRVSLAAIAAATAFGVIAESKVAVISALVASILNVGLAVKNTSTDSTEE
jgi:hypothetical protein